MAPFDLRAPDGRVVPVQVAYDVELSALRDEFADVATIDPVVAALLRRP